jgi:proteasome accessory factor C
MPKLTSSLSGEDRYNFMISLAGYLIRQDGPVEIRQVSEVFSLGEDVVKSALSTLNLASAKFEGRPEDLFFDVDQDLLEDGIISFSRIDSIEDAPKLSTRQASAISAGLQYLASIPEFSNHDEIKELIDLLAQATGSNTSGSLEVQQSSIDADFSLVRQAIVAGQAIACEYINTKGELRQREIEPLALTSSGAHWYLFGYCPEHREGRNFRLDRMRSVRILDREVSTEAKAVEPAERATYVAEDTDTEVLVEVTPEAFSLIAESQTVNEPREMSEGTMRATIRVGHLPNLGRIISRYGGAARVLEPQAARDAVRAYALRVLGDEQISVENED